MNVPAKGAWSRPRLVVLVRSGSEEAVLLTCKTLSSNGPNDISLAQGCHIAEPPASSFCSLPAPS